MARQNRATFLALLAVALSGGFIGLLAGTAFEASAQSYGAGRDQQRFDDRGGYDRWGPCEARFEPIAQETYDRRTGQIQFRVDPRDGPLEKIKLRSEGDYIAIESIRVRFADGGVESFSLYDRVGPGEETAPISFEGSRRPIVEILVIKRPSWRPGQAGLTLLGERRFRGSPPGAGPQAANDRWERAAVQTYDRRAETVIFLRGDQRLEKVGQIRFRALGDPIVIQFVKIRFGNGDVQRIELADRVSDGETSAPVDLSGERRNIVEVIVAKRPSFTPGFGRLELQISKKPRPSLGVGTGSAPPGWLLFGIQSVGLGVDRDTILVGHDLGQFERIALRVTDNDVFIREITIVYAGGERDTKEVYTMIPQNSRTRAIDLRGDRFIQRIELLYEARPDRRSGRAMVEVYGDYASGWLGDRGRWRSYNAGWALLGAHRALRIASDQDAFLIGPRVGPVRKLKLVVRRHAVRITGMRVVYANGEAEYVPIFTELLDGQSSPVIDLSGRNRYVERVELRYRTKLNFIGQGIVELWGAP